MSMRPWWVSVFCLALFAAGTLAQHLSIGAVIPQALAVAAAGAIGGALGGACNWRRGSCGVLRMFRREAAVRGALYGALAGLLWSAVYLRAFGPWLSVVVTVAVGFCSGVTAEFLQPPERRFAEAVKQWRGGRRSKAVKAIEAYLKCADEDPRREVRVPLAEQFLRDERASLEMVSELVAAPAPPGRGTEPEAAAPPAGRGTELLPAPEKPERQ